MFRVAIAGCGGMANTWIDYAKSREDVEIVALVDIKEEFAQARAQQFELHCPVFTDIGEAIRSTGADLVFDVTIPDSHFSVVSTALRAGCNVFGEKPMAASMEQARDIVRISRETGKRYSVMQNRRYIKNIRAFRELVQGGTIGQTGYVGADFFLGAHFGGFRDLMDNVLILDMAIHTFDQARFLMDADPVSVYCHEFNPPGSWYRGNASALAIFEFSDGSVFDYRGSWCAEGAQTSWEATWRVQGSLGTAMWDGHGVPYAEIVTPGDPPKFIHDFSRVEAQTNWNGREWHTGCLDEMFTALNEGRPAETDATDNIHSVAMVFGAIQSAREGRKVMLTD